MTDLDDFAELGARDHGLVVISTTRADGSVQSSVVNAGVMTHPTTGDRAVALVAAGGSAKLAHLRRDPRTTIVLRAGWEWVGVEGTAEIVGPDDEFPGVDADARRVLLRDVFTAAGGSHDDWDDYDRTMVTERRAAVLITPTRIYGVRPG